MGIVSAREMRENPSGNPTPHVVVLGAGASRAALPDGDGRGVPVPLMTDLDVVAGNGWRSLVWEARVPRATFEARFAWLKQDGRFDDRLSEVEAGLAEHFARMTLPGAPTTYDHLLLGMRGQDTIATFNWDPFLLQTYQRHVRRFGSSRLPDVRFLRGSVVYATCEEHDVLGVVGAHCVECGRALRNVPPVYPTERKDYVSDPLLRREWDVVLRRLRNSFQLTIFGYSGPGTDAEARQLMRQAWAPGPRRADHLEVLDLVGRAELERRWRELIPYSHLLAHTTWDQCSIARWPRRTMEWKQKVSLYGQPAERVGPCRSGSLAEVDDWYAAICDFEHLPERRTREAVVLGMDADAD